MSQAFFIPAATPENQEEVYETLAGWCGMSAPPPGKRIYSIEYRHDGTEWTATVGQTLRGEKTKETRVKGRRVEQTVRVSDPAIVLAIFNGNPAKVVTNNARGTQWVNPFMAGIPTRITYFVGD